MTPITVRLPWPAKTLSPNARFHWGKVHRAKKKARQDAYNAALAAGLRPMKTSSVLVTLEFRPPSRQPRDLDNMLASMKAALDGISDAIKVDDSRWDLALSRGDVVKDGAVIVRVIDSKDTETPRV